MSLELGRFTTVGRGVTMLCVAFCRSGAARSIWLQSPWLCKSCCMPPAHHFSQAGRLNTALPAASADEYNTEMGRPPLPSSFRQAKRHESRAAAMARGQGQGYPIGLAAHAEEAAPQQGQRQQEGRRGPIEWALRKCRGGDGPENPPANKFRVRAGCMWAEPAQLGPLNGLAEACSQQLQLTPSPGLAEPHVVDRLIEVAGWYAVGGAAAD